MLPDRYERQRRAKEWNQALLSNSTVIIAGAGALGNEIIKNLALVGIGKLLIIDFDQIELTNLNRTVLFRDADIGKSKAREAARAAMDINPDIDAKAIDGNLFFDIGLGFYRDADLIISGLDNIAARTAVGRASFLTKTPFVDGGTWAYGGEVRVFLPGRSFCFDCTLSDADWKYANVRRSCAGFRSTVEKSFRPAPISILPTATIGALVANESVKLLYGRNTLQSGTALVFNGLTLDSYITRLPGRENCDCKLGRPFETVKQLLLSTKETRASKLLTIATKSLGNSVRLLLGRDLLVGFDCPGCSSSTSFEEIQPRLSAQTPESELDCPNCGNRRLPRIINHLHLNDRLTEKTLDELKVPPGEILAMASDLGVEYFELTKDVHEFWNRIDYP